MLGAKEVPMRHQPKIMRKRRSRAEWVEEVRRWRQSGRTAAVYASERGLHAGTLAAWASKLRDVATADGGAERTPSAFLPVRVTTPRPSQSAGADVEIVLNNGRRVRVGGDFQSEQLARLLAVVEGGSSC